MSLDKRSELEFWRKHLLGQTLLKALSLYPDSAKRMFGDAAIRRENILELGMILGAREILACSPQASAVESTGTAEMDLQEEIDKLSDEQQDFVKEFLSITTQDEIARKVARRIIKDATGVEPISE